MPENSDDDYDADAERQVDKLASKIIATLNKRKPTLHVAIHALAEAMIFVVHKAKGVDRDTAILEIQRYLGWRTRGLAGAERHKGVRVISMADNGSNEYRNKAVDKLTLEIFTLLHKHTSSLDVASSALGAALVATMQEAEDVDRSTAIQILSERLLLNREDKLQ